MNAKELSERIVSLPSGNSRKANLLEIAFMWDVVLSEVEGALKGYSDSEIQMFVDMLSALDNWEV